LQKTLEEFEAVLNNAIVELRALDEAESAARSAPSEWSRKEILGHLLDSAFNNHQRFVRGQLENNQRFPGYDQAGWVRVQDYQGEGWQELVQIWHDLNRHLLHIARRIPAAKLQNLCTVADYEPVTLQFLVEDYVVHLKGHLLEILPDLKEVAV
jgi:hypothetical protein